MDDSMEASAFEVDASSDFEPAPKAKAKAPPKKATTAPKPKATKQTTLKPAKKATSKAPSKSKKPVKPDSDVENSDVDMGSLNDDSLLSNTPPSAKKPKKAASRPTKAQSQPLAELANESFNADTLASPKPKPTKKGGATDQYQKLTQLEHILKRPDTYIGSVENTTEQLWVYNSETQAMENRKVSYVPGLYKIFDEILVNAADNKQRDKNMNELRVWVDATKGVIAVKNNGRGIPVEMHAKEGIYIPEMIFGHLLTSSNYDDDEAKVTGGRNGYGAKLTNIYSTQFDLETVDSKNKKRYKQTWRKNMSVMEPAKIDTTKEDDYTKITFKPDFGKFGMEKMDEDFEALVKRRVYDMAGTCTGVKVFLNGERIKINKFKQYMEMYTKAIKTENAANDGSAPEQVILTDNPHERWEIGFAVSDGSFQQVSFVNSIATMSGGSHVNFIADQICDRLEDIVNKKNKGGVKLKKSQIRNHIFLFVNCLVVNPAFTSQTKEQLTTKPSMFGSKPQVGEKFLKDIAKTEAVNNILHFAQQKADKVLSKSDGKRRERMNNSKLTDANKAGTKDGHRCTLILTEGDSASLLALAGRAVVNPDLFGVFPLRGKLLNVRDASIDQISKNQEIQNIKKFMGLQHKKDYTDAKSLRYGHLMIMTDQDHDGSHIKGLLINFLQCQFPSLLKMEGFLMEFITPIVKVWKGDPKHPRSKRDFFTMPEYEAWREEPGNQKGWDHKYYKGLGTSDTSDAEIYFSDLDKHLKEFHRIRDGEPEMIDLAFSKKKADARKQWLGNFVPGTYLDMSGTDQITYDDFINKELILFSMADNMRSIPSVVDGFKPGQRKVLYTCFRRNLKKDVKVVELAGSVSGLTAYAYGETSLQQTIVGLAQNFVGSNNINCLEPSGNFGSRLQGGQDAASARYIYTRLSPFARRIFHQTDEPLLTYNTDDGNTIEPEVYAPIVPMILINGADGIGTGWSTSIPNYNPIDVVDNLKRRMAGNSKDSMLHMSPWFKGWGGEVEQISEDRFKFTGTISESGDNELEVTELPVRLWTQDFKDRLEEIIKAEKTPSFIKDYTEYNTPTKIHFIIKMEEKKMSDNVDKLVDLFKLSKTMATSNLVAFDAQNRIHKYASVLDIMEEFYHVRLQMYHKRRKYMLGEMQRELEKLTNQARFIQMIIMGELNVSRKKKAVLVNELQKLGFTRFPKIVDARKANELEAVVEENDDESEDAETAAGASDYDYLLGMAIWSLTQERVDKLNRQIGDKEEEITILTQKTEKDLWNKDLDDLVDEWNTQLEDEAKKEKKNRSRGRRVSAKLGIGGKAKKRKAGDSDSDDDFVVAKKPKAAAKPRGGLLALKTDPDKPAIEYVNSVEQKPVARPPAERQGLLDAQDGMLTKPKPAPKVNALQQLADKAIKPAPVKKAGTEDSDFEMIDAEQLHKKPAAASKPAAKSKTVDMDIEMSDEEVVKKPTARRAAAKKQTVDSDLEMSEEEVVQKPAARRPAAKKKTVESDSDGEDVLAAAAKDVPSKPAAPARGGRAAAKKTTSYAVDPDSDDESDGDDDLLGDVSNMVKGIGSKTNEGATRFYHPPSAPRPSSSGMSKSRPKKLASGLDISEDETDWAGLAQNSPQKATNRTVLSEEEDDSMDLDSKPVPAKQAAKPAAKAKATTTTKTKEPAAALKPKKAPAKATAAAESKPLSPAAKAYAARQGKAAAAPKASSKSVPAPPVLKAKKKTVETESESDGDDVNAIANDILSDEDEDDSPPKPAARPSRRAAAAPKKGRYVDDDDDEEDDEDVVGGSEDSFDEGSSD